MARKAINKPTRSGPTPVASIRHQDKRANIPTEELRDFVAEDEKAPRACLYPRDPSLDPQLVWKGKDEQDGEEHQYHPDFVVVVKCGTGFQPVNYGQDARATLNLLIEVTGEKKKDKAAKVSTARNLWVPAINNHGGYGRWAFLEIADPWDAVNLIRWSLATTKITG